MQTLGVLVTVLLFVLKIHNRNDFLTRLYPFSLNAIANAETVVELYLTFSISPKITDMEKIFAKKLGLLAYKQYQVLNFGASRG